MTTWERVDASHMSVFLGFQPRHGMEMAVGNGFSGGWQDGEEEGCSRNDTSAHATSS